MHRPTLMPDDPVMTPVEPDARGAASTSGPSSPAFGIRPYRTGDLVPLVAAWHRTNVETFTYVREQQRHTLDDATRFFREHVVAHCEVAVAATADQLVGVIAIEPPWIRQLAVFAGWRRRGVGSALLRHARQRSPSELRLFTFRRNASARAFYATHNFVAVAYGTSPAPEHEPDVEYRWTPHARGEP